MNNGDPLLRPLTISYYQKKSEDYMLHMKWYEMSLLQKKQIIYNAWCSLNIRLMDFEIMHSEEGDTMDETTPVDRDGHITFMVKVSPDGVIHTDFMTYRSIQANNFTYVAHVLKTLAHKAVKDHFNLNGAADCEKV